MRLIFLHGPPAAGKYTIAKELERKIGCGVFHNHLTMEIAKQFFEFGTEYFWKLVKQLRYISTELAAKHSSNTVVYTACYSHPQDLEFFEVLENLVLQSEGEVIPVYLSCELEELERRVSNLSRVEMGKIKTIDSLRKNLERWNCISVPRDNCLFITTNNKTPSQCCQEIIDLLHLSS